MSTIHTDFEHLSNHINSLFTERRQGDRSHCAIEAVTQIDGAPRDTVYLSNISQMGALMIVTLGTIIPEKFELLGVKKWPLACRRVWQNERHVGITFDS